MANIDPVAVWLEGIGLKEYYQVFRLSGILTLDECNRLNADKLMKMGVLEAHYSLILRNLPALLSLPGIPHTPNHSISKPETDTTQPLYSQFPTPIGQAAMKPPTTSLKIAMAPPGTTGYYYPMYYPPPPPPPPPRSIDTGSRYRLSSTDRARSIDNYLVDPLNRRIRSDPHAILPLTRLPSGVMGSHVNNTCSTTSTSLIPSLTLAQAATVGLLNAETLQAAGLSSATSLSMNSMSGIGIQQQLLPLKRSWGQSRQLNKWMKMTTSDSEDDVPIIQTLKKPHTDILTTATATANLHY